MGILAIAGGIAGAGQGITDTGREGAKVSLAEKVNAMQKDREEAITRLQQQGQTELEGKREEFEKGQTQTKITAASGAAGATREFEKGENEKKLASEEKRTGITAQSRVDAATVRATASEGNKAPPKTWEVHAVTHGGFDPTSKLPTTTQTQVLMNNRNGSSYMQIGDKFIRYDSQKNAPAFDPKSLARAPAADINDLLKDPLGTVPSGTNQGLTKAEAFEQTHGYLPASWASAAQNIEQQQKTSKTSQSLPSGLLKGVGGPGATSTKVGGFGGGPQGEEDDGSENAAQSGEDASSASPPFQSNAMSSYSNMAQ